MNSKLFIFGMMILIMSVAAFAQNCPICEDEPQSRQCDVCRERDILRTSSCDACRERDDIDSRQCDVCRERDVLEPRKCTACIEPEEKVNPFNCKECNELQAKPCDSCRKIEVLPQRECKGECASVDVVLTESMTERTTVRDEEACQNNECEPISEQGFFGNFAAFFRDFFAK